LGAHGYVIKEAAARELPEALHEVLAGRSFRFPMSLRRLSQRATTVMPTCLWSSARQINSDREIRLSTPIYQPTYLALLEKGVREPQRVRRAMSSHQRLSPKPLKLFTATS
jgi:hypothetical protein